MNVSVLGQQLTVIPKKSCFFYNLNVRTIKKKNNFRCTKTLTSLIQPYGYTVDIV